MPKKKPKKKREKRRRHRGGVRRRRVTRAPAPAPPRESDERRLLAVARQLSALTGLGPADAVRAALTRLAPPAPARAGNKGPTLALAWAREQTRLALTEVLERGAMAGVVRRDVQAPTLAWLVLAACEALAHEPNDAAPDRLQALAAFVGVPDD